MTPEELTNPNVDEKSVMTYLSQFPRARPLYSASTRAPLEQQDSEGTTLDDSNQSDIPVSLEWDGPFRVIILGQKLVGKSYHSLSGINSFLLGPGYPTVLF